MRKFVLLLLLFFAFRGNAQNEYFLHNPEWTCTSICDYSYPCMQYVTYNYYINGDSIINSYDYKKVFVKSVMTHQWMTNPPISPGCDVFSAVNTIDTIPSYFIRSAGKQMYVIPAGSQTENLLYDFNLNIGDIIALSYVNSSTTIDVFAIDSVYTPYGYRKRFALSNSQTQYLIEGIGSSHGLFEPIELPLECTYSLDCYSLNDTAWYPQQGPACDMPLSVLPTPMEVAPIDLYPNPASDLLTISAPGRTISSIRLFDFTGKQVSSFAKLATIDVSTLAPGLYVAELTTGDGITRKLFVKQ